MIAQFTAKTANSEKAIYFLSLMFCSINKLKSPMFFTCKNFMFPILRGKKNFAPGNGGGKYVFLEIYQGKEVIWNS